MTLTMKNISKNYQDGEQVIEVLKNVSLEVAQGEFVAIVGPSGAGKSTFLSIAGALLSPTEGEIAIGGKTLTKLTSKDLTKVRLDKIGFIFQGANLIPYLNVRDQLLVIAELSGEKGRVAKEKADKLLQELGLTARQNNYPESLSGGEKQRVAIARALMNNPDVILADEPTASLDANRGHKVVQMIADEVKRKNKAAIMVTHDERVLDLVDRVIRIEDGYLKD
ncbi:ABC transporter ATP-binding protein [Listeria cossartiae subsp. cayugensis]|uniref:ABC transporter ATP-binding protein n=1 Tax=Listeria cossartiae subsp. cayugensis TaxID=2713505 RepID=A0ABU2ISN2_9LIST|nr:ABC transporter ATP-binding protein [Listeria cossartiae]MDT0001505.1 ABC transporter ATP-binding protein [Listeria cossartiae subsp. cayugensis]MDT0004295.1 ABC transporter ATP-binding protein [Listeria cossartiae subsp. cayugensis]MDT0009704.1 ABC transporter ATP-binding protein [Listeria cossartiae subsp. cayugensis]MDT0020864.1 ABC transporter ATP-binding protein [Listeria cossartiae subsp. cayugensis]MDT0031535.1 ABC transporter ATP-binding protein [Listeria cossartiae subsp. cayugensi